MQKLTPKTILILFIMFSIAMLHVVGPVRETAGVWHDLYYSYFSDLVLPFGFYFLLCQTETKLPVLRRWWVKAGLIFGAAFTAEVLQFFGVYALGVTFDPLDVVMYATGALLAVIVERGVFSRLFSFWEIS